MEQTNNQHYHQKQLRIAGGDNVPEASVCHTPTSQQEGELEISDFHGSETQTQEQCAYR